MWDFSECVIVIVILESTFFLDFSSQHASFGCVGVLVVFSPLALVRVDVVVLQELCPCGLKTCGD